MQTSSFFDILTYTDKLNNSKERKIIAIDGRCGSGKTSLAAKFSKNYGCTVFHMDDFFLQKNQRTEERLNTPGGNVDYERFLEEILLPLKNNWDIFLRKFNHTTFLPDDPVYVPTTDLVIVEGTYSLHTALRDYYDFKIFVSTDNSTQSDRILARNGKVMHRMFMDKWIPLEEKYFLHMNVENACDVTLLT